jgi:hypothetical protein
MTVGGSEAVLFQDKDAYVSRSRIVLHGVTYPVGAISSLRTVVEPKSALGAVVCAILGGCAAFLGFAILMGGKASGFALVFLAVGLAMIVFPIRAYRAATDKTTLILSTQGREVHALTSHVPGYVERVVMAIHEALAAR